MSKFLKTEVTIGAVAVLPLAACGGNAEKAPNGETVTRAATGDLATNGGVRRFDGDQSQSVPDAVNASGAKNVILLIGDGVGDSEITLARNYAKGAGKFFSGLDSLPLTGQYTTYALQKNGKANYVTDSAASATAWSTGTKTYNGALSIDIKGATQKTIMELANSQGRATGDITTSEIQDATPRRCSPTSPNAIATARRRPPRTAEGKRSRTVDPDRSRSNSWPLIPTSPWAAAPRRSRRRPTGVSSRERHSRCRPRSAASKSSAPQAN